MTKTSIYKLSALADRRPEYAIVGEVDLVVVRFDDAVSVFYGRCLHRGALMSDGHVRGNDLICGVHNWDYRLDSGVSAYANDEKLPKFEAWVDADDICVDADEIFAWGHANPQPYNCDAYLGLYADPSQGSEAEPYTKMIQSYAKSGLSKTGHHGQIASMGVPRTALPDQNDLQLLTAQLAKPPLLDKDPVDTDVVIGPNAKKPLTLTLTLKIPLFVTDMSFGALSDTAKVALARRAEMAGTGICSGEGGMLPEEQAENTRYFYERASAPFGISWDKLAGVQAFHFKGSQGAKTGTGGHLPGEKGQGKIAEVRGLKPGTPAVSPARFPDWTDIDQIKAFADEVRFRTGGIPIG